MMKLSTFPSCSPWARATLREGDLDYIHGTEPRDAHVNATVSHKSKKCTAIVVMPDRSVVGTGTADTLREAIDNAMRPRIVSVLS